MIPPGCRASCHAIAVIIEVFEREILRGPGIIAGLLRTEGGLLDCGVESIEVVRHCTVLRTQPRERNKKGTVMSWHHDAFNVGLTRWPAGGSRDWVVNR